MPDVIAIARQGLAVGGPAEVGFDKVTLGYVPGSVLRGALASAWIREHGIPDAGSRREEFVGLFERDVRYGPLFQDGTAVVPLTAIWCKYPATGACREWSADAAVDGEANTCPHCGGGTDAGKGEVTGVRTRRVLRTELDDDGRPLDEHLYARHELEAGAAYRGRLTGSHPWLLEAREIWLGGRTSTRGLAAVQVVPDPDEPARAVRASARPDGALVVRLASPAIVVDDAGRPTMDPVPEILRVLGMPRAEVTRRCWTRPVRVGGWHAASGLPKPTELAMELGSVAVLGFRGQPGAERLQRLAEEGIGLRRVEGFGSVELNPAPWRRAATAGPPADQAAAPSVLAALRVHGLLRAEATVRWLVSRCRLVLVERERDPGFSVAALLTERVPVFFDDAQADAVTDLFASPRLAAAIPLLEQELERLTGGEAVSTIGGSP
jgi:CRISPR-associated protein Csx10